MGKTLTCITCNKTDKVTFKYKGAELIKVGSNGKPWHDAECYTCSLKAIKIPKTSRNCRICKKTLPVTHYFHCAQCLRNNDSFDDIEDIHGTTG